MPLTLSPTQHFTWRALPLVPGERTEGAPTPGLPTAYLPGLNNASPHTLALPGASAAQGFQDALARTASAPGPGPGLMQALSAARREAASVRSSNDALQAGPCAWGD